MTCGLWAYARDKKDSEKRQVKRNKGDGIMIEYNVQRKADNWIVILRGGSTYSKILYVRAGAFSLEHIIDPGPQQHEVIPR